MFTLGDVVYNRHTGEVGVVTRDPREGMAFIDYKYRLSSGDCPVPSSRTCRDDSRGCPRPSTRADDDSFGVDEAFIAGAFLF